MRILIIQNEFALSGAPVCAFTLAKYLKSQGHTVFAVSAHQGEQVNDYVKEGIKCVADPGLFQDARASYNLAKQVDLVICFTSPTYQCVYGAKGAGKPVIFAIHEVDAIGLNWARDNLIFRRALELADFVTFPSQTHLTKFKPYMKDNGVVIPMGFETIDVSQFPVKPDNIFRAIIVGSLEPRKNQLAAIEAIKNIPNAQLTIVGRTLDHAYGNMVINAAKEAKNVNVRTAAPREDVLKLMNQHDVLLLTSKDEVQSLTIPEAYLLKKPVVAANVGGLTENVEDGKTGFLINPINTQEITEKLVWLKENPDKAKEMGEAGFQFVTTKRTLAEHNVKYQELLDKLV